GPALAEGFRETSERYGLLLDTVEFGLVHRIPYTRMLPVGAKNGPGEKPPPKLIMQLMLRLHPALRRRRKSAEEAERTKLWLEDLRRWDEEVKPATIARSLELLRVETEALSDGELVTHLGECADWLYRMIKQHHEFNGAALSGTARLLVSVTRWTGLTVTEILPLLAGASPVSSGWVPEGETLADAIAGDPEAQAKLASNEEAASLVDWLRSREGAVGEAARAYLAIVGYRVVSGYDIGDRYALETPKLVVEGMRRAASRAPWVDEKRLRADTESIRARIPAEHLIEFHELLAEARETYHLRDERGLYSDLWAAGIARRAILGAGKRVATAGRIHDAEHLIEASLDEMRALILGQGGPSSDALAERFRFRRETKNTDAPAHLGPPIGPPPPLDWMPKGAARRAMEALELTMASIFTEPSGQAPQIDGVVARGSSAFGGVFEGRARLILGPDDFDRIEEGDVLITTSTSPAFNIVLPLVGGIVTDHGGVLSHAAIVAREFGIPAVVACGNATTTIPDGAKVRIDGDAGEVTVL
ncbi:MAG: PEP-utilizing enzyme, partial [Chloroflexi bacterium]|nr:PEP-utilizing enzyme [Chloroflexota bacterium]